MIIGLDISTSITGVTILNKESEIIHNEAWDTRKYNTIFKKTAHVNEKILDLYENYGPDLWGSGCDGVQHIFIEQNLQSFRSGFSSAKTLSTLSKFNGIVSWLCYDIFEIEPQYIAATTARKLNGIRVPRGTKAKQVVMQYIADKKLIEIEYTKAGNPRPEYYDRADSLIIAKAGYYLVQEALENETPDIS